MTRLSDSRYCYYHDKLLMELTEPEEPESYPVWPLNTLAYLLVEAAVAA